MSRQGGFWCRFGMIRFYVDFCKFSSFPSQPSQVLMMQVLQQLKFKLHPRSIPKRWDFQMDDDELDEPEKHVEV